MQHALPTPKPMQNNTPPPIKRYVFGAVFIPQKGIWLLEGTYPSLVVEALTLPALLEKASWAIKAIEDSAKKEADAIQSQLRQAH